MSSLANPRTVTDNLVVSLGYELQVDGEVIDSSLEEGPIEFIQGAGEIIPGLESALYGMQVGESKKIAVPPEQGYGAYDPEAYAEIPRRDFPEDVPLERDVELQLGDEKGHEIEAYIESWDEERVRFNLNHRLAGKTLHFTVTVLNLRQPTPSELEHGHVHTAGHHH